MPARPSLRSRAMGALVVLLVASATSRARAQAAPPAEHEDAAFDVMTEMSKAKLHDIESESWNVYGQSTYISSWKLPFSAAYTNLNGSRNSLTPDAERGFTWSLSFYFGLRLWEGAEAYFVPEVIAERALSQLRGLGGAIQNFELQKNGSETPRIYRARTFLRQTIGLGGHSLRVESDPMQLGTKVDARRLVLTAGSFSILDMFSRNTVSWDPHQTFLNMAFMTYAAWDFPSDARGYSWGGAAELYYDDWALRVARITPPQNPNQLEIDFRLTTFYGDQAELEHKHTIGERKGAARVLAFRNHLNAGRFDDAVAAFRADPSKNATTCPGFSYAPDQTTNAGAPDLCWARRPNDKVGIGLDLEQEVTANVGVFFRGMFADGRTEVYAYNAADRSVSLGVVARGGAWKRPFDVAGLGFGASWISDAHIAYLRLGGIDGFIGDGTINPGVESVVDVFYSLNLFRALWVTPDYQHITNPAYNRDRGAVDVIGARAHAEF